MMIPNHLLCFLLVGALTAGSAACTGTIGEPDGDDPSVPADTNPGDTPDSPQVPDGTRPSDPTNPNSPNPSPTDLPSFKCDPTLPPGAQPLQRLSILQYRNTLADLFSTAELAPILATPAVQNQLSLLPADGRAEDAFPSMDPRISARHIEAYFGISREIAREAVSTPERLKALAGDCATQSPLQATCLRSFLKNFGEKVYRRPLSQTDIARYEELFLAGGSANDILRSVLFQLLMSPDFNYHLEVAGTQIGNNADYHELTPYELASRLSYHFWQSMPDDELRSAARDGSLATDAGYRTQLERLFAHNRTKQMIRDFYAEWLRLQSFGGFSSGPAFAAFSDGQASSGDQLYWDAVDEIQALIDYYTWTTDGTYRDILTSDLIVTQSAALAALYGVQPWDGRTSPARFPEKERSGLLTRAAMLMTANEHTNPFRRGAFIVREIMCRTVPEPDPSNLPPDALNDPPSDPTKSTRERFEKKTEPAQCAGCHSMFNPYGFALESYDSLGRFRLDERIFDEQSGDLISRVPVNSSVSIVEPLGTTSIGNPQELIDHIVNSGDADLCFARHYFRYAYRRDETTDDHCTLARLSDELRQGKSLREALKSIALDPLFRRRVRE